MGLVSILKVNKYKRFSFTPRYYDERRERRDELIRELEEEKIRTGGGQVEYRPHLRSGYMKAMRQQTKKENNTSVVRLLVILAALAALFYWLLR